MDEAQDSIQKFCDHIGIEPVSAALRAIDRHNIEHVWLVLPDGERVYYHSRDRLQELDNQPWYSLKAVGVGGIAWDDSDWEWADEGPLEELPSMRAEFECALAEHSDREHERR